MTTSDNTDIGPRPTSSEPKVQRALDLNAAMLDMALEREGLTKVSLPQIALLREASLVELAGVAAIVHAHDEAQPRTINGGRSFHMVADDRLVAAIYAFVHFTLPPASTPYDDDYVILRITDTTHTYFLVGGARENSDDEGEDE